MVWGLSNMVMSLRKPKGRGLVDCLHELWLTFGTHIGVFSTILPFLVPNNLQAARQQTRQGTAAPGFSRGMMGLPTSMQAGPGKTSKDFSGWGQGAS